MDKFQLYLPVKPKFITQKFGEIANVDYYHANNIPIVGHNGTDLLAYHGQPVYASHDGVATYEWDEKQGDGVVIVTDKTYDYKGSPTYFKSIYWHFLPDYQIPLKTPVKAGDFIGYADSTGLSTGDHVHWGLKPTTSPNLYEGYNIEQTNGYLGCIDPMVYWNGLYAEDIKGYKFTVKLQWRDRGQEVVQLQKKLQKLGYFPLTQECTGYYGIVTTKAVLAFQIAHIPDLTSQEKDVFKGMYFGPKSITAINLL